MNEGYVKIYRKTIRSQVFQNEGLFKVWMWCLLKANHKGQWVSVKTGKGTTEVWIEPGQFIFGRKKAAKELKMKPSTVRNRILKLKNMGNLDIQSNSQYSIIIIINWDTYQAPYEKEGHPKRTAKGQPKDTNKNDKKEKNTYIDASKKILTYLNQVGNRNFTIIKANLEPIQARLEDGHTEEECKKVIDIKWADPDFNKKYFRPTTLFRPTKFEGYLNEKQQEQYDGF